MNILYISKIPARSDIGLYWSVPNQVVSQSFYDKVFWYNLYDSGCDYWSKTGVYHSYRDFPNGNLVDLPYPFNIPDLVIFEGFYEKVFSMYIQVRKARIPYIVVPRGCLTIMAQKKKHLKKYLGNLFFFKKFANNSLAIQYLTEDEKLFSGNKWNKKTFIMPNGVVNISDRQWKHLSNNAITPLHGCFIGRYSIFHKGLDLLVDACAMVKEQLIGNNVVIDLYGPDFENQLGLFNTIIEQKNLQDVLIVHNHSVNGLEKEKILCSCNFFVQVSRLEGHSMGLIEALSYGLPCLVTRGSNMLNEIEKFEAGWTAENNAESISKAIIKMINGNGQMVKMSKNAISLAKCYRWDEIAKASHEKYIEFMNH